MAVLEGVEGIPVLFVAWDQPDVFRLGTGFEFQTLVWNCLKCQRKYCFLQLNTTLALSEWLTTFYLETPYASVADVYICICSRGGGKNVFRSLEASSSRRGLEERTPAVGWCGCSPSPPANSNPLIDSTSPSSLSCCRESCGARWARPKVNCDGLTWGDVGGEGLISSCVASLVRHKDEMLASRVQEPRRRRKL